MAAELDWNVLIPAVIGSGGILTAVAVALIDRRRNSNAGEETAYEQVSTPVSPGNDSLALDLAQYAVTQARGVSVRLDELESRFTRLQRAYSALFNWARRIESDWDHIRTRDRPPPLPEDAHYTE